jgi:hypothetical protein
MLYSQATGRKLTLYIRPKFASGVPRTVLSGDLEAAYRILKGQGLMTIKYSKVF